LPSHDVFISYRRDPDHALAQLVKLALEKRGYRVVMDVSGFDAGPFEEQIEQAIGQSRAVVPIITAKAIRPLDGNPDWMLTELQIAAHLKKRVVPFFGDGFSPPPAPDAAWKATLRQQGVHMSRDFPEAAYDKLAQLVGRPSRLGWKLSAACLLALALTGTVYRFGGTGSGQGSSGEERSLPKAAELLDVLYRRQPCPAHEQPCPLVFPLAARVSALRDYLKLMRKEGPFEPPGLDLHGLELPDARLTGWDLSNLNLEGANFSRATMNEVDLTDSLLMGATLVRTNLIKANLVGASLNGADLRNAGLISVRVSANTSFINSNLCGTWIPEDVRAKADMTTSGVKRTRCPDGSLQDDCSGHWSWPPGAEVAPNGLHGPGISGEQWTIANLDAVCPAR
jgi:TIR domain-containing protein/pentapeptide repeat protein